MYDRFVNCVYIVIQLQIVVCDKVVYFHNRVNCSVCGNKLVHTLYIMIQLQIVMFDKSVDFHN